MRVFVTGVGGQLGYDVVWELHRRGIASVGSGRGECCEGLPADCEYVKLDITDAEAADAALCRAKPDAVIHCAAWTAVDAAEEEENKAAVFAANVGAARNMAEACRRYGAKLVYLSTDYVFDGSGTEPWSPDCERYAPLNYYGLTKRLGEQAVMDCMERYFIIRTSWVFGVNGSNFVKTMLRVGRSRSSVRVVNDQIGTPTYTEDLAGLLADMIEGEKYGVYHASNEGGFLSWYDFTREIYRLAGYETEVIPVTTEEYGLSRAARPRNSRLDKRKLAENGFRPLPDWRDALKRYLARLSE